MKISRRLANELQIVSFLLPTEFTRKRKKSLIWFLIVSFFYLVTASLM